MEEWGSKWNRNPVGKTRNPTAPHQASRGYDGWICTPKGLGSLVLQRCSSQDTQPLSAFHSMRKTSSIALPYTVLVSPISWAIHLHSFVEWPLRASSYEFQLCLTSPGLRRFLELWGKVLWHSPSQSCLFHAYKSNTMWRVLPSSAASSGWTSTPLHYRVALAAVCLPDWRTISLGSCIRAG